MEAGGGGGVILKRRGIAVIVVVGLMMMFSVSISSADFKEVTLRLPMSPCNSDVCFVKCKSFFEDRLLKSYCKFDSHCYCQYTLPWLTPCLKFEIIINHLVELTYLIKGDFCTGLFYFPILCSNLCSNIVLSYLLCCSNVKHGYDQLWKNINFKILF